MRCELMIAALCLAAFISPPTIAQELSPRELAEADRTQERPGTRGNIITDDVERFYMAVALAEEATDPVAVIQREYLDRASPGLRYYHESGRLKSAEELWTRYRRYPGYYEVVREFYLELEAQHDAFEAPYRFFESYLADPDTPPVYAIIGHFNGGATLFEGGLVVALDNWAADWQGLQIRAEEARVLDPVEVLLPVVAHELAHFHQGCWGECGSALAGVVKEGSADFLAWLVTGARSNQFNLTMYEYYDAHEAEIWSEFLADAGEPDAGPWLYDNSVPPERVNLGYAIGHAISKAYYDRYDDKSRAIRDILGASDYAAFLKASGYAPQRR